ncbi:MAG: hypothetical protein V4692_01320 [Bdellovibrionota bacterium]
MRDRHEGRGDDFGRRDQIDRRRTHVRDDRARRNDQILRQRDQIRAQRNQWRGRHRVNVYRDISRIRTQDRWSSRYDNWYGYCPRPRYVVHSRIRWYQPMPSPGSWQMAQVEAVAVNMEHLTRTIYDVMSDATRSNPNGEYVTRLLRVLTELEDASENFTDAVNDGYDYSDSLNDLFYLEEAVQLAERTLDGYSKAYMVDQEMGSMRFHVEELLWTYRQNY